MNLATTLIFAAEAAHGGFGLHQKLIVGSTVLVVGLLIALALIARGQIGIVPKGFGAAFEHVFDWIDGMSQDMIGSTGRQYVPLLMSFFLFILVSNWSGLLPIPVFTVNDAGHHATADAGDHKSPAEMAEGEHASGDHHAPHFAYEAPTVSYNTTLALAIISFFAFNYYGLKKNVAPGAGQALHAHEGEHHHHSGGGLGGIVSWFGHFFQPIPMLWNSLDGAMKIFLIPPLTVLFFCLNVVEELARILSLSIRLFGNISGEHQVKVNLLSVMQQFLGSSIQGFKTGAVFSTGPGFLALAGLIWGSSIFATLLGALAGFVQAMVFTMLSLVYVAHAVADEH